MIGFFRLYSWFVPLGHDRFIILLYLLCLIITCFAFNQVELIIEEVGIKRIKIKENNKWIKIINELLINYIWFYINYSYCFNNISISIIIRQIINKISVPLMSYHNMYNFPSFNAQLELEMLEWGNYVQNLQDRKIYRCVQRPDLAATTLNNLTRNVSVNRYAELFSVTVVKGAAGEILDSWAPNGSQQQL